LSAPQPAGHRYRGLIWPALLIVLGGIALLVNTGVVTSDRLYRLGDLWPVLLIVIGLELFITRTPMPAATSAVAAVLVLLIAAGGSIAYVAIGPAQAGSGTVTGSAPGNGLDHASLEVDVGGATLNIVGSDLGSDLYNARIEYSGPAPNISFERSSGHVQISQNSAFHFLGSQRFVLDMKLSTKVKWTIVVHSGAAADTYDFSQLQLSSLEDDTGASREDVKLGTPSGNVPVTINGGALTVHMHRPSGALATVSVSGGAVSLDFDGHQQHAVGQVSFGASGTDMFDVRINGGACTVTMDTSGG
jgi:hypothetical protein